MSVSWVSPGDTLYKWWRESKLGRKLRKRARRRHFYDLDTKLRAVELYEAGRRVDDIARECGLHSKTSVYAWAQKYSTEGEVGFDESERT